MTAADLYPSVTLVAGPIAPARPTSDEYGGYLRMNDGAIYIQITKEMAAQWLPVIASIAEESN